MSTSTLYVPAAEVHTLAGTTILCMQISIDERLVILHYNYIATSYNIYMHARPCICIDLHEVIE